MQRQANLKKAEGRDKATNSSDARRMRPVLMDIRTASSNSLNLFLDQRRRINWLSPVRQFARTPRAQIDRLARRRVVPDECPGAHVVGFAPQVNVRAASAWEAV